VQFGSVVDRAGQPLAHFVVEARPVEKVRSPLDDDTPVQRLAGRDGRFPLDRLREGEWSLVALGPGHARSSPLVARIPWKGDAPTLVVVDPVRLDGVVLGRNDAPVEGAEVFLAYPGEETPTPGSSFGESKSRALADANGRFSIAAVRPGRIVLVASHSGFCNSEYLRLDVPPEGVPEVRLHLREGARVVGSVDPSMGRLADREVHLYSFNGLIGWRETRTDAQGGFEFEHVIPQEYVVELKTGGSIRVVDEGAATPANDPSPGTPSDRGVRQRIETREGETTRIVLGGVRRRVLGHGRITCRGVPLVDAQITANSLDSNEDLQQDVRSGDDGAFSLELAGAGRYEVSVYWQSSHYGREFDVPDEERVDLSLAVPSGGISGRVVAADGRAVADVDVTLTDAGRIALVEACEPHGPAHRARTNESGAFEFRLLPPGTYSLAAPDGFQFVLPVRFVPYGRAFRRAVRVDTEIEKGIELKLGAEGRIAGKIVDSLGGAAGGAMLLLKDGEGRVCSTYWETRADEAGAFLIRCVAPGTYRVVAWRDGREGESAPVDVEADRTAEARVELGSK
jgi:protocatechuate 3,4-dioxygenase beta subunit